MNASTFVTRSMTCPICCEIYDSSRAPLVLQCGHTFCDHCLAQCIFNSRIYCPNRCHTTTPVDQANPQSGPPINAALVSVLNSCASATGFAPLTWSNPTSFWQRVPPQPAASSWAATQNRTLPTESTFLLPGAHFNQPSIHRATADLVFSLMVGVYGVFLFFATHNQYCEQPLAPWVLAFGCWWIVSAILSFVVNGLQRAEFLRTPFFLLNCASIALYVMGMNMTFSLPWEGYVCPRVLVVSVRTFFLYYIMQALFGCMLFCMILLFVLLFRDRR